MTDTERLFAAEYIRTNMGGDVMGYVLAFGAGELLLSDEREIGTGGGWTIGLYPLSDSEPARMDNHLTLEQAIETGEVYRLQASGNNG